MTVLNILNYNSLWLFFYLCELAVDIRGHGRLVDPPARGTMWRMGFDTPPNYNDHELFCGGFAHQWTKNKGRCGECGDPWDLPRPRPNESGGTFGVGALSKVYREGEEITVTVHLTANHLGWFEFRMCANNEPKQHVKQSCLNKNVLRLADHSGTRYEVEESETGLFRIKLNLPNDVTCSNCVLQWHYTAGNNWGNCKNGQNKPGCGPQEVFRGCSDIAIFSNNDPDYYKYENLTRKINFNEDFLFDKKTGMYDIGQDQEDSSGESHKKKIPTVQTMDGSPRKEKNEGGQISSESRNKKNLERQNGQQNGTMYVNSRWDYTRNSSHERKSKIEEGYFQKLMDKFRNPNYFSEEGDNGESDSEVSSDLQKYISSDSFRRHLDSSSSEVAESKKSVVPSRKLRLKSLTSLLNRLKIDRESSEMYKKTLERKRSLFVTPVPFETVRRQLSASERSSGRQRKPRNFGNLEKRFSKDRGDDDNIDNNNNTVTKISQVISLLLNLTASSPSSSEANALLDNIASGLSAILAMPKSRGSETTDLSSHAKSRDLHQQPSHTEILTPSSPASNVLSPPLTASQPVSLLVSPKSLISFDDLMSSGVPVLLSGQANPGLSSLAFQSHVGEASNPVLPLTLKDLISILNQRQQ